MSSFISIVVILVGLLVAAWFGFSLFVIVAAVYYCGRKGRALQRELGFRYGSACLPSPGLVGYTKAVAIDSVVGGGAFDRAGFRQGDVLPDVSVIGLFKLLHRRRGGVAEIAVVDGGSGPPFGVRSRRVIRVFVPPSGVP